MRPFLCSILLAILVQASFSQDHNHYLDLSYEELDSLIKDRIEQGRYPDAVPMVEAYISIAEKENIDSIRARALDKLGLLHWHMGSYDQGLPFAMEAKDILEKASDNEHTLYAEIVNNLGLLYEATGDYRSALPLYLEAKDIWEKEFGEAHPQYALALHNLASLHEKIGNYDKAMELLLITKDIDEKELGKEHPKYGASLNNLASLHEAMGNYERALPLYLQAKDIWEKALGKEHPNYAISLNNLALVYEALDDYKQALALYLEAKGIEEQTLGTNHPDYAITLNNLASVYESMENYQKALPFRLKTKEIFGNVLGLEHPYYGISVNNLAGLYVKMASYDEALPLFLEAKEIWGKALGLEHPLHGHVITNLASLHEKMGNYEDSWEILHLGMSTYSNTPIPTELDEEWYQDLLAAAYPTHTHFEHMTKSLTVAYHLLQTDPEVADSEAQQILIADLAHSLLNRIRNQVSNEDDKLRILAENHHWLLRSLEVLNATTHADKAFNRADENKSVLLLQATKSELAFRLGDLPDSLVWQEKQLLARQGLLQASLLENPSETEKENLLDELNHINMDLDSLVSIIEGGYPKYHKIKYQHSDAKVQDIQASLAANTALLEYVVGDSAVHIFYVDQEQLKWHRFQVARSELQDRIQALHRSLNDYASSDAYEEYTRQGHWFYKNLVAPGIAGKEGITNLIVVPDGELGHLPFETFLVEEASEQTNPHYLLHDYSISYSYSATLWKENLEAQDPKNNGQMLAVAADYDVVLDTALLAVRLPTDQWRRGELTELPAARKEVESLEQKYVGFFAFDTAASERMVKAKAPNYSILHFATHGFLDEERPVLSSLAFTENSDSTESNFWQAYEISKTQLNADLVVLSACETGYGKFETGNGIASLARAFMYAGAPALVVSLWQVHDESTADLMTRFYDYLDSGMKKDEALRQAKLDFIQSTEGIQQHPAFWSPFIMMGKTDAINIKKKGEGTAWAIGVAMFGVLVMGGIFMKRKY